MYSYTVIAKFSTAALIKLLGTLRSTTANLDDGIAQTE